MKKYYIAYGSNLSVEQMRYRAPDAKIIGTAILEGWQLRFRFHATVERNPKKSTPVLVWEISRQDERNLDCYEGYPGYYIKENVEIDVTPINSGEPMKLTAMVYLMTEGHPLKKPSEAYYRVLEQGYKEFHFPMHILEKALADSIDVK